MIMWIEWVENNFRNSIVIFCLADLENLNRRIDYEKSSMSPSVDRTMPESEISQKNNSPLDLYMKFHNFRFFFDVDSPVNQVHQ